MVWSEAFAKDGLRFRNISLQITFCMFGAEHLEAIPMLPLYHHGSIWVNKAIGSKVIPACNLPAPAASVDKQGPTTPTPFHSHKLITTSAPARLWLV